MNRLLVTTLLALLGLFAVAVVRWSPPPPRPRDAPVDRFSAERAMEMLGAIVGDGTPRAVGSESLARARGVALRALRDAGFEAEEWEGFACHERGFCAHVTNVVARRAGTKPATRPVLLVAHLDSVTAGPGAGDDGIGTVTVLEVARALGAAPPVASPIAVLLTDGEEAGLLGALAFVADHPLAAEVETVINVDSRGTRGPSMLFEVEGGRGGTASIVSALAGVFERPVTSSVFAEVYRRMPNDTDFSAFRGRARGVNFGNVAGVERYHTAGDTVSAVDPGTVQHHGDQILAAARAFASGDVEARPGDAIWFDVLSLFVVRAPRWCALFFAAIGVALAGALALRRRAFRGAGVALAVLVVTTLASLGVGLALGATSAVPAPWIAYPEVFVTALHLAVIAAALAIVRLSPPTHAGGALVLALLGLALAYVAPGACHLFVVPALAAGAAGFAWPDARAAAATAIVTGVLWLPLVVPLYVVLGTYAAPVLTLPAAVLLVPLAPLLPRASRRVLAIAAASAGVATIAAALLPPFSAEVPQRVNVHVRQDDDGPAWVMASASWGFLPWGEVPRPMREALGETTAVRTPMSGLYTVPAPARETPPADVPAPEIEHEATGDRVRLRVRSKRGASVLLLELDRDDVDLAVVVGGRARPVTPRAGLAVLRGVGEAGVELSLATRDSSALVRVADVTAGVDASAHASAVVRARPVAATTTQDGDLFIRGRSVRP